MPGIHAEEILWNARNPEEILWNARNTEKILWNARNTEEILWNASNTEEILWNASNTEEILWNASNTEEILWNATLQKQMCCFNHILGCLSFKQSLLCTEQTHNTVTRHALYQYQIALLSLSIFLSTERTDERKLQRKINHLKDFAKYIKVCVWHLLSHYLIRDANHIHDRILI